MYTYKLYHILDIFYECSHNTRYQLVPLQLLPKNNKTGSNDCLKVNPRELISSIIYTTVSFF